MMLVVNTRRSLPLLRRWPSAGNLHLHSSFVRNQMGAGRSYSSSPAADASSASAPKSHAYGHTLNLPRTAFPLFSSEKAQLALETRLLPLCTDEVYSHQQQNQTRPTFTLHDGPPFANGRLHMGEYPFCLTAMDQRYFCHCC